ncbi:hypothetical protein PXH80_34070, partial [Mycolicibacterium smegmatis]|nr:hypothetical protein [Mycolicibacterium smegmatis]
SAQRLAVVGARDDAGRVWAGPLTGPPGFLSARGETTVVAAAVRCVRPVRIRLGGDEERVRRLDPHPLRRSEFGADGAAG